MVDFFLENTTKILNINYPYSDVVNYRIIWICCFLVLTDMLCAREMPSLNSHSERIQFHAWWLWKRRGGKGTLHNSPLFNDWSSLHSSGSPRMSRSVEYLSLPLNLRTLPILTFLWPQFHHNNSYWKLLRFYINAFWNWQMTSEKKYWQLLQTSHT